MTAITPRQIHPTTLHSEEEAAGLGRIERSDMLQPGCYWRVTKEVEAQDGDRWSRKLLEGDVHLLVSVFEFDGQMHSVNVLSHPRDSAASHLTLLIADFLRCLEPMQEDDALAVREAEQAEIRQGIADIQEEMAQASVNPLAIPGVKEAAEDAVEAYEANEAARVQSEVKVKEEREADLRRIHRRAARRSEAKGNPLAVRRATISDRVEVMISEGLSSDGLRDLSIEAGRRIAIAESASKFLKARSEEMGRMMKALVPYLSERSQLALAKANAAITMVNQLNAGIRSLRLYTGDAVDVVTVLTGEDAPSSEPLTLIQGKRYMDQELAVWADVQDSFDWSSQDQFFQQLQKSPKLLDQVLPLPRCVVSMAVTARNVQYSDSMHWYDRMMAELNNRRVFLLVRNGGNVHVVYSDEPSHEAASRLFPSKSELDDHFRGVDGSSIGLNDVRFSKASKDFEETGLVYKRFLILLAGLDHRERLFGQFYPPEDALSFMSLSFQQRYFRFISDEDEILIEHGENKFASPSEWINWCNSHIRSGSRIALSSSAATIPIPRKHKRGFRVTPESLARLHIAAASKGFHGVSLDFVDRWGHSGVNPVSATIFLDGPDAPEIDGHWFLCLDRASLAQTRRFLYSRRHRTKSLSWLRLLRRAEDLLAQDDARETELRAYLRRTALEHRVRSEAEVDQAVDEAISTWRAANRGIDAPDQADAKRVNEILTLIYPKDAQLQAVRLLADELATSMGLAPLRLARTGKGRYALYTESHEAAIAEVQGAVAWRWVHRHSVTSKGGKLVSTSSAPAWLDKNHPIAAEETVCEWSELEEWVNDGPEPVRLSEIKAFIKDMEVTARLAPVFARGARTPRPVDPLLEDLLPDDLAADIVDATRAIQSARTYYDTIRFLLPLAIVQEGPLARPRYIYAAAHASRLMERFASEPRRAAFRRYHATSQQSKSEARYDLVWELRSMKERQPKLTVNHSGIKGAFDHPQWASIQTHAPGGVKRKEQRNTAAERRKNGGDPTHRMGKATLSFSRAFDTLMGLNPASRRSFYKSQNERVLRIWGGMRGEDELNAERRAERKRRYEPTLPVGVLLAPVVWDHERCRGVGNKAFAQPKNRFGSAIWY